MQVYLIALPSLQTSRGKSSLAIQRRLLYMLRKKTHLTTTVDIGVAEVLEDLVSDIAITTSSVREGGREGGHLPVAVPRNTYVYVRDMFIHGQLVKLCISSTFLSMFLPVAIFRQY